MNTVGVYKCPDYEENRMQELVKAIFEEFGIASKLSPDTKILVKPNLLMKRTPEEVTTTHPSLVKAVIKNLENLGCTDITLADSPGGIYTKSALEKIYSTTGMTYAVEGTCAKLNYDTSSRECELPGAKFFPRADLITPALQAEFIFDLAKMKTHGMTTVTGAAKNLFGLVAGLKKPELHFRYPDVNDFANALLDLAQYISPGLAIMDAVVAMEGEGPSGGTPRQVGLLLASDNVFDLDLAECEIMGVPIGKAPLVYHAAARGLCAQDITGVKIVGDGFYKIPDYRLPVGAKNIDFTGSMPKILIRPAKFLRKNVLRPKPVVRKPECVGCALCAQSCPPKTISMKNGKAVINYNNCISCLCCHEMCPEKAISVKRFFLFG